MEQIPFTYLIKHLPTGRVYYGVRYAKKCHPNDLWTTYFTSCKEIQQLVKTYGAQDFVYEIRKTFSDIQSARLWETRVLTRMDVVKDSRFFNKTVAGGPPILWGDLNPSKRPEIRKLLGKQKKKFNPMRDNPECRNKLSKTLSTLYAHRRAAGIENRSGWKHTKESKEKMSKSHTGVPSWNAGKYGIYSKETLLKMSEAKKGRKNGPQSTTTKTKISKAREGKQWYTNVSTHENICCLPSNAPGRGWVRGLHKSIKPIPPHMKKKTP